MSHPTWSARFVAFNVFAVTVMGCRDIPRAPPMSTSGEPAKAPVMVRRLRALRLAVVDGAMRERETILQTARARQAQLGSCYMQHGLQRDSLLSGDLNVRLHLGTARRADAVAVSDAHWSSGDGTRIENCVLEKVRAWAWPASVRGRVVLRIEFRPEWEFIPVDSTFVTGLGAP